MFVQAIEEVSRFTSPIFTIQRSINQTVVRPGAATMFFVNDSGVAITCRHVANLIPFSGTLAGNYNRYREARLKLANDENKDEKLKALAKELGFEANPLCQLLVRLNCAEAFDAVQVIPHPKYDLAIVKLVNPRNLTYSSHARFLRSGDVRQGKFLCRLGFPFPEFKNFRYNEPSDTIEWTQQGIAGSPRFPIEGMVTRHLADEGGIFGIEMSTPGLKGQSGGPLFDEKGIVYGMQFATNHLHLGFDMHQQEILSNGEKVRIEHSQPFLHVGLCIHANLIKKFLQENKIDFEEAGN